VVRPRKLRLSRLWFLKPTRPPLVSESARLLLRQAPNCANHSGPHCMITSRRQRGTILIFESASRHERPPTGARECSNGVGLSSITTPEPPAFVGDSQSRKKYLLRLHRSRDRAASFCATSSSRVLSDRASLPTHCLSLNRKRFPRPHLARRVLRAKGVGSGAASCFVGG
jgi:hypothetical protein